MKAGLEDRGADRIAEDMREVKVKVWEWKEATEKEKTVETEMKRVFDAQQFFKKRV